MPIIRRFVTSGELRTISHLTEVQSRFEPDRIFEIPEDYFEKLKERWPEHALNTYPAEVLAGLVGVRLKLTYSDYPESGFPYQREFSSDEPLEAWMAELQCDEKLTAGTPLVEKKMYWLPDLLIDVRVDMLRTAVSDEDAEWSLL